MVELDPGHNFEVGLRNLEGYSHIWLVWWFHKNSNWRPTTLPPRGRTGRKGVFSSRSPYRPNPIAISCVQLLEVRGLSVFIGAHDLLDETPILDIKPYIPEFDSFPEARDGWYGELSASLREAEKHALEFAPELGDILQKEPRLRERIEEQIALDPYPHRTRRIVVWEDGYRLSCGDWRVFYRVEAGVITVTAIAKR